MTEPVAENGVRDDGAGANLAAWGGKGASLVRAQAAGMPVPAVVALAPAALLASLTNKQRAAIQSAVHDSAGAESLDEVLLDLQPSPALLDLIADGLNQLGSPGFVAVRSSASDEDGPEHAFAGQLESFLFVPGTVTAVARRVADVWRSAFSPRVWAYRSSKGIVGAPRPPAVLLQVMLNADAAGVAFSADPVTGARDVAVVSAVRGLASALVDGRAEAETVRVDLAGRVLKRDLGRQQVADRLDNAAGEGVCEVPIAEISRVLTDQQIARVASLARRASEVADLPQDIEWAFADGDLWLVQARPITALPPAPEPTKREGRARIWDNSNIVESYAGVTTPLTFSFARRAYEAVYRSFCELLRVPRHRIDAESGTFAEMIGLVRGRIYYNLGNWYRVLALLPGYRINAPLMESMMGVKEPIPEAFQPAPAAVSKLRDALEFFGSMWGLLLAHWRLPKMIRDFYSRLGAALALPSEGIESETKHQLASRYKRLESELLTKWDAPLVNDFFAMIWFGLANRLAEKWIGPNALGNLLTGDGDVISAEPARLIRSVAESIQGDISVAAILQSGSPVEVSDALALRPDLTAAVGSYQDRFGDRCLEELKLESATLVDNPMPLYRSIGAMAERLAQGEMPPLGQVEREMRAGGEDARRKAMKGHPLRRFAFAYLLKHARARVRDRENLRFERTRVFGRARRLALLLGARLTDEGRLINHRDVFFLEVDELLGAAADAAPAADLVSIVANRAKAFESFRDIPAPPERFVTYGEIGPTSALVPALAPIDTTAFKDGALSGLGCCPGIVDGPVRVVRDPRGVTLEPGTILVAERTDPGWILLFPACKGLIVERGSLLSHSAIVARELGIPAIVAVEGATRRLHDGDIVRMNGATGEIDQIKLA